LRIEVRLTALLPRPYALYFDLDLRTLLEFQSKASCGHDPQLSFSGQMVQKIQWKKVPKKGQTDGHHGLLYISG